jgi:hypothetical protein
MHKNLIHVLEDVILAMEAAGESDTDIHSWVNMILKGFVRDGEVTPEYIQLAADAGVRRNLDSNQILNRLGSSITTQK